MSAASSSSGPVPMAVDSEPASPAALTAIAAHGEIDESLYSRQLYVLGHDTMRKMGETSVFISGMGGAGVELAKNIILTGVRRVVVHDTAATTWTDLSSQFYLTEADLGKNRAEACAARLAELNPYVAVQASTVPIDQATIETLHKFQIAVFVDYPLSSLLEIDDYCRTHNVKFVAVANNGLAGMVFCDFGDEFIVIDADGEQPFHSVVTSITSDTNATVTINEDDRLTLGDCDTVRFEGLVGCEELNTSEPMPIKVIGTNSFTIGDTTGMRPFVRGGYVHQVKQPKICKFKALREALKQPEFLIVDFAKMEAPLHLHVAFLTVGRWLQQQHGALPRPHCPSDADAFVALAKAVNADHGGIVASLDENLVRKFAMTCAGRTNPVACFLGGVAAQEVLKACSGKFSPICQFLYFDAFEALPTGADLVQENDAVALNTRYDGQIAVFGRHIQERLLNSKWFIVGAGALGCEFLKNFAMMGIGCGPKGSVVVTDMDNIEISNLSRQFLFRKVHVGKQKSEVAAAAAKAMNPDLNVSAMNERVGPDTENVFTEDFWDSLDGVCNALDNVQARLYVDSRCVFFKKPLLESGTLGTKANTQVVVPFVTESYGSSMDPPEKGIPICTLKNFPYMIEHTIQWAREMFDGLYVQRPSDVNGYLTRPDFLDSLRSQPSTRKATVETVLAALRERPMNFDDCVRWARLKFEELYNWDMRQLLFNFAIDAVTKEGTPFWSGTKRPPTPLHFNAADPQHMDFIVAAANLQATVYGLRGSEDTAHIARVLEGVAAPGWQPKSDVKIAATDAEAAANKGQSTAQLPGSGDDAEVDGLIASLPKPSDLAGYKLVTIEFDKDDDGNYHMEFVTAASNMRARCYNIPEADRHKTKLVAGRIIPAMVTTTALITGLVNLELVKMAQGFASLELFRNAFVNLALPFFTMSEPVPPKKSKWREKEFSLWSVIDIPTVNPTLQQLLDYFTSELQLDVSMLASGTLMMFSPFADPKVLKERLTMKVSEVFSSMSQKKLLPSQKYLLAEAMVSDTASGDEVEIPSVRIRLH